MKHINPTTEESRDIKETPLGNIPRIVEKAKQAQEKWRRKSLRERIRTIRPLSNIIEKNKERISKIITEDMGKPLQNSRKEVQGVIEKINFFCNKAPKFLKKEKFSLFHDHVVFDPLGVIAVISPWNYPFSTSFARIIPALLCGNSVILKTSEYSPSTGILIGEIFSELEHLPKNVFTFIIGRKEHGKELVKQDIDMISFTGSIATGKKIMEDSAKGLHKLLFELGGLDAAIVLKDVNIKFVAKQIVWGNILNSGQLCYAIKRVYVEKEIYDKFTEYVVEESKKLKVGNPIKDVDLGPLVSKTQLKKIEDILKDAVGKGAKVLIGGKRLDRKGYFFPPTVVVNVNHKMILMNEEPFGPILPIYPVSDWKEAVDLSNCTKYGLCGSVWTKNLKLGKKIAQMLEVGTAGINVHGGGPLGTPWGGAKNSGIGRANSKEGFRVFTNVKLIRKQISFLSMSFLSLIWNKDF